MYNKNTQTMENNNDPILELWGKTQLRAGDYAGALGFSQSTLKLILEAAKENDLIRVNYLAQSNLEFINNVFVKHNLI